MYRPHKGAAPCPQGAFLDSFGVSKASLGGTEGCKGILELVGPFSRGVYPPCGIPHTAYRVIGPFLPRTASAYRVRVLLSASVDNFAQILGLGGALGFPGETFVRPGVPLRQPWEPLGTFQGPFGSPWVPFGRLWVSVWSLWPSF